MDWRENEKCQMAHFCYIVKSNDADDRGAWSKCHHNVSSYQNGEDVRRSLSGLVSPRSPKEGGGGDVPVEAGAVQAEPVARM